MLKELTESILTQFDNLFGLEIKSPKKNKKNELEINSPVIKVHDDGAAEIITGSGGVYYQSYNDFLQTITSERQLVMQFRKMATCPEVSNAIEEIVNDAIVYPRSEKYPVRLDLENVELSEGIKDRITDAFDYVLSVLEFDEKAHIWFRHWYVDGRLPFYILPFENGQRWYGKRQRGIKNLIYMDPLDVKKVREIETQPSEENAAVNIVKDINEFYVYFATNNLDRLFVGREIQTVYVDGNALNGIKLTPDSVIYATSGYYDDIGNVLSYLYDAIKAANQLGSLEESMLIYRISRAPSRRVFYVDVGNLPTSKAEQYLTALIAKYKNRVSYDSDKGRISSETIQRAMVEDYWLPRREGGKGTEISTIAGSDSFSNMTDELDYFKQKLYTALKVPVSRFNADGTFTFAKTGEITRNEVKFSKFINHLRRRFANQLFNQLLKTECVMERIITDREWKEVVEPNIEYIFDEDSYFAELKEIDVLANRIGLLQTMTEYVPTYFSQDFVRRHVLFQTDEDIAELAKQREQEKKTAADNDEIYNDVSGDKALSVALSGTFKPTESIPSVAKIGATSGVNTAGSTVHHTSAKTDGGTTSNQTSSKTSVTISGEG